MFFVNMKTVRYFRKFILGFLSIVLMLCFFAINVYATEDLVPCISINEVSVEQGSQATLAVSINDVENYSALDIQIFYDQTTFTIQQITYSDIYSNLPAHEKSSSVDSQQGSISYAIVLSQSTSIEGVLFYINLSPALAAEIKTYSFALAINGVYSQTFDSIEVSKVNGRVSVTERTQSVQQIYYQISSIQFDLTIGDQFVYAVSSNSLMDIASSNYEIYYDSTLLDLISVDVGNTIKQTYSIYSINQNNPGYINIGFVSTYGFSSAVPLIIATFEIKQNVSCDSTISFIPKNSYNENREPLLAQNIDTTINLNEKIDEIIYPKMRISSYDGPFDQPFDLLVSLDENSGLAAGDFVITYDPNTIIIDDIENLYLGSYFAYNHNIDSHQITFSIININGLTQYIDLLRIHVIPKDTTKPSNTSMQITGQYTVDKQLDLINIEYANSQIELSQYYSVSFIDYDGSTIDIQDVKEGVIPNPPVLNPRVNTLFNSWSSPLVRQQKMQHIQQTMIWICQELNSIIVLVYMMVLQNH